MSLQPALQQPATRRCRVRVRGAVQGVGFRPFVYRLARRYALSGWVKNDGDGVIMEIQGAAVDRFLGALRGDTPRPARVDTIEVDHLAPLDEQGFVVADSEGSRVATTITPDQPVCEQCLDELFDPADRRYLYPFINCSHCGPRYTLTRRLPYDRVNTSMQAFPLCRRCEREYANPGDRRLHAQATACPDCGPRLSMPVPDILQRLQAGEIIALKGIGGFHLVCDARDELAVARLRRRKQRDGKPFAVMAANLPAVRWLAHCDAGEAALLQDPARPIVLLRRRSNAALAPGIAPGLPSVGVILPYAPLHYLLFHAAAGYPRGMDWLAAPGQGLILVMTSANPGGEPLITGNAAARAGLGGIADTVVSHDREIVTRADDSVMLSLRGQRLLIRRGRGMVPEPIKLRDPMVPTLALGAYLKNTVCVTRGDEAYVSQHIGDLDRTGTLRFYEQTVTHMLRMLDVRPEIVAHDLHPDFHSSRYALHWGVPTVAVQHHHAHVAAVVAEHGLHEPVLGLALDGFGLGTDGGSWGGELLWVERGRWQRLGHLRCLPQPGGDMASRQPWRMGAAALHALGHGADIAAAFPAQGNGALLARLLQRNINTPATSSAGRWFDAACGLLGVVPESRYEGHAAMVLEGLVRRPRVVEEGWRLHDGQLDLLPLLAHLRGCQPAEGADLFHGTLIAALADWVQRETDRTGIKTVILAGGCFLNRVLAAGLTERLEGLGLAPLLPRLLPPNDGGISLGQAWIAADPACDISEITT